MPRDPLVAGPRRPPFPELPPGPPEDDETRRCSKRKTNGDLCQKWAVRGTDPPCCTSHGAMAPQVRNRARRRVEAERIATDVSRLLVELEQELGDRAPVESMHDARVRIDAMVTALSSVLGDAPFLSERAQLARHEYGLWVDRALRASKLAMDANLDAAYLEFTVLRDRAEREAQHDAATRLYERITDGPLHAAVNRALAEALEHLDAEIAARASYSGRPPGDHAGIQHRVMARFNETFARLYDDEVRRAEAPPRDPDRCHHSITCRVTPPFWWCTCPTCCAARRDCGCDRCVAWLRAHGDDHPADDDVPCPCPACELQRAHRDGGRSLQATYEKETAT